MEKEQKLQFFLLRYVPNILAAEFINIGIVVIDAAPRAKGFCEMRFTDWRRVQRFDKHADITTLRAIASGIEHELREPSRRVRFFRRMKDSFSNSIQLSPRHACVTQNIETELKSLARQYLTTVIEPVKRPPQTMHGSAFTKLLRRETLGSRTPRNPVPTERRSTQQ